jgi:hypothetical protein
MKKLFVVIACLFLCGTAIAAVNIESGDNAVICGPYMGPVGTTPVTEVIKVSTGAGTSAKVGDAMLWNTTWGDGYHVQVATTSDGPGGEVAFAGVMVTKTSQDSAYGTTTAKGGGPTIGYMAVRGLVRARIASGTAGQGLQVTGGTTAGSLSTAAKTSGDIGTLLKAEGAISRIWLK